MSQLVKFGDVVENLNLTASDTQLNRYERVVGLEHMIPNELKIENWDLMANLHEGTSFRRIFKKGHVLFGKRRTYQRKVALADFDGICSSDILVFSAKKALLAGLLPYVVQSERFFDHANQTSSGSLSPRTRWQDLAKFTFQLPSLDEQARIVELMTAVDEHLEALQQELEASRTARNAVLNELLESMSKFPLKKLKDLTTKIGSGATPRGGESVYQSSGITLIRSQNVHNSVFSHEGLVAIDDFAAKALNGVSVEPNDVLINITGASVARTCLVDETVLPARVNQHVAIIRTRKSDLLPGYLLQTLLGQSMNSYLLGISGSGSTRQAITKAQLEELEIVVPPIAEQERFVKIVSSIDDVIQATERAIAEAKVLRTTLLNQEIS